jgi:hypothetical protein
MRKEWECARLLAGAAPAELEPDGTNDLSAHAITGNARQK